MADTEPRAPKRVEGPSPGTVKTRSYGLQACPEYAAWLESFARSNRTTISGLVDQALAEYAQRKGFTNPPDRV